MRDDLPVVDNTIFECPSCESPYGGQDPYIKLLNMTPTWYRRFLKFLRLTKMASGQNILRFRPRDEIALRRDYSVKET